MKPRKGGIVYVHPPFAGADDPWVRAKVQSLLATQFTAVTMSHGLVFLFYKQEGDTWTTTKQ